MASPPPVSRMRFCFIHPLFPLTNLLFNRCAKSALPPPTSGWTQGNLKPHIQTFHPVLPVLHACRRRLHTTYVHIIELRTIHRFRGPRVGSRALLEDRKVIVLLHSRSMISANRSYSILGASRAWFSSFLLCQFICMHRYPRTQWKRTQTS